MKLNIVRCDSEPEDASERPALRLVPHNADTGPPPPDDQSSPYVGFDPDHVFYEAPSAKYYVKVGTHYRVYSRKTPVINGIATHFTLKNPCGQDTDRQDSVRQAKDRLAEIETISAVDWAGNIAGHPPGILNLRDSALLVTEGPRLIEPVPGPLPVIGSMLDQTLGTGIQQQVFMAWLAIGLRAVIAARHQPGPMMCLAGPVNTGKSLLANLVRAVLGGRSANPHTAWSGTLPWNDDLIGAELQLMDDCEDSIDIRARRQLAARFKEAIYSNEVQMRKRHTSSISVRPVWRVMLCCNDTPESLQIIPPIDDDLSDKVILLSVSHYKPPVDTSSIEGRDRLWTMISAELPAFVDRLRSFLIPQEIMDPRSGVIAYRDHELEKAVTALSPERVMAELIMAMNNHGHLAMHAGGEKTLTATELQELMVGQESVVSSQARTLFGRWPQACGVYLGKLARSRPDLVQDGRVYNGTQRWIIKRPSENPSGGLVETLSTLEKQKEREGGDGARMKLRIREMNPPIHQG
jgi:hypothetical protein